MYARVVYTQVQPGQIDEAIRIYRESVTPNARLQKGYRGGILLTDRGPISRDAEEAVRNALPKR